MADGQSTRTTAARAGAALGFLCGVIGFVAGVTEHAWKFEPLGWFMGGALLTLLSLFVLAESAVTSRRV